MLDKCMAQVNRLKHFMESCTGLKNVWLIYKPVNYFAKF